MSTWLAPKTNGPAILNQLRDVYLRDATPDAFNTSVVALLGQADGRIAALLSTGAGQTLSAPPSSPPAWLSTGELPAEVTAAVRTAVASRLSAYRNYEEAHAWLAGVEAELAPAPVLVHYLRAVAEHQLVDLEAAQASAEAVLACDNASPRCREIAELILRDARGAEPETPRHVARTMNDIRRRLELGRAANPEQELQQEVLAALDKMIKQAEEQQKQQQQQQASSSSPGAPSAPMQQSRPAELKGPGEVDPREVAGPGADWGALPPQERKRVTQQIGRDFPAYYRDMIEAYFRSLAESGPGTNPASEATP